MKIIIDIPEEIYDRYMNYTENYVDFMFCGTEEKIVRAIRNGTPLPKGHGDLIDRTETIKNLFDYHNGKKTIGQCIDNVPTIIEADKEYKAEVITRGNCMICGKKLTEGLFLCKECGDKENRRMKGDIE